MANAYTWSDASSLGTSLVQTALDKYVRYQLRSEPIFRAMADTRAVDQTFPSASIVFQFWNDITDNVAELSETEDPDAIAVPSTTSITVTLKEYGATILYTRRLQLIAITDVTGGLADQISWHMRDQLDKLVAPVLTGGTHVVRVNGGVLKSDLKTGGAGTTGAVASGDVFTSEIPRFAVAKLRGLKVLPRQGELYATWIHPDVSHDLRKETGSAGWRDPHNFSGPESIWSGMIGQYEGAYYIESPRMPVATDGASSAKVYRSLVMGREALAEAVAEEPSVRQGPTTDKLGRFTPLGWYGMLGWNRFREDALIRVETSSSIA
ncbi:N4-gp56 family major capsid protein [Nonomuraea sp. NPDC048881]|uniref:N4-gp56 family major capsid protein n=1 Tax=Nonomuraea sp. NPDC048881 TaxID=3155030 RepID=UPI0033E522F8